MSGFDGAKVKKGNEKEGEESKTKGGGAENDFFLSLTRPVGA